MNTDALLNEFSKTRDKFMNQCKEYEDQINQNSNSFLFQLVFDLQSKYQEWYSNAADIISKQSFLEKSTEGYERFSFMMFPLECYFEKLFLKLA